LRFFAVSFGKSERPGTRRLLARIYEVFPMLCPGCRAEMHVLAFITAAEPVDAILRHLGLPATPPPSHPPAVRPSTTRLRR
jgi:hypothetical protein